MSNSLISVIIPVYNVEDYLIECLESVFDQTYKNIEIIAINDGSTDNSLGILEDYASSNKNLRVISQENSGQSVARNVGINLARGTYIYFLDSDDYIAPETFEHLIRKMEKYNLDLIRFGAEPFFDKVDKRMNSNQYDFSKKFDTNKIYKNGEHLKINTETFWPSPVLYMVRKDSLVKNDILFKPHIIHEDVLFTLEVFLNASRGMYDATYYYKRRYRPNSVMTSETKLSSKKSFDSRCIILDELNKMLMRYKSKPERKLITKRINTVMTALIYEYQNLDRNYKEKKMKELESFPFIQFFYCVLRWNLMKILTRVSKNGEKQSN